MFLNVFSFIKLTIDASASGRFESWFEYMWTLWLIILCSGCI